MNKVIIYFNRNVSTNHYIDEIRDPAISYNAIVFPWKCLKFQKICHFSQKKPKNLHFHFSKYFINQKTFVSRQYEVF